MSKNDVGRIIKRIILSFVVLLLGIIVFLGVCLVVYNKNKDSGYVTFDENLPVNELIKQKQEVYKTMNESVTITPEEAARGKTIENTKRTVNKYGITIYGKPISEQEVLSKGLRSEIGLENDKKSEYTYTYSEYYSDAYGGIVYIKTTDKSGGIVIYNNDGQKFLVGDKPQNDIEVGLANYRMGNAMAEAIDRSVNKK